MTAILKRTVKSLSFLVVKVIIKIELSLNPVKIILICWQIEKIMIIFRRNQKSIVVRILSLLIVNKIQETSS